MWLISSSNTSQSQASRCLLHLPEQYVYDVQSCVAWMARHALLVWPTKAFAQLPDPIVSATRAKVRLSL